MSTVYIITRHGFDSLENHNPWHEKVVGCASSQAEADAWVAQQKDPTHQGWDGKTYPYWTVTPVEQVKG